VLDPGSSAFVAAPLAEERRGTTSRPMVSQIASYEGYVLQGMIAVR
jgi:hypothetical protein